MGPLQIEDEIKALAARVAKLEETIGYDAEGAVKRLQERVRKLEKDGEGSEGVSDK